jgi:MoaA/NifB/PqqE/SkfB family radical SAM enzyme
MLNKGNLYRMPWSMNDNPIAWLEVTDICNIHCEGCYRQYMTGHKTLEDIKKEVLAFKKWRNPDNVSIAGGEPLLHPQILEVISFIKAQKIKPIILTNGLALTPELLKKLKEAGLAGFTLHIDSHQGRPEWRNKTEKEMNELRQYYTDMVSKVGGLYLVFNSTVYPSSFQEIPDVVKWGQSNLGKVHGLVFITYRTGTTEDSVALTNSGQEVDLGQLSYSRDKFDEEFVKSPDVYRIVKSCCPEYEASGYLGGTLEIDSFKWLIGGVIGSKHKVYGSIGKKTMEIAQAGHHLFNGTYLAYLSRANIGLKIFISSFIDKTVDKARCAWMTDVLQHPGRLFSPIHVQSIGVIQAPDLLSDGRADMCDSCPDMTWYNGKLINSCRMDEYRLFGGMLSVVERSKLPKEPVKNEVK